MKRFNEYKRLDLVEINNRVLDFWGEDVLKRLLEKRESSPSFCFYEGPPSANGAPGIHHVVGRTIKDIFCRYKTLKGFRVERKAGWDTHGLPVELGVEKNLKITKEDIGEKISVEQYNKECRQHVMKYKGSWEKITSRIGYWVDMKNPYVTYENKYIESVWWLLKEMHKKGVLYKGHTIQPYSPKAGTGLSTHELNQPGCYKSVKDVSVVAQFKIIKNSKSDFIFNNGEKSIFFVAWTTTPWTLPSNTALAVGKKINYVLLSTVNRYTGEPIQIVLAKDLLHKYFSPKMCDQEISQYNVGEKNLPYKILKEFAGEKLEGVEYEQIFKYVKPEGEAFKVLLADFVTTEDGTGIVHLAPSFGSDDSIVAKQNNIGSLTLVNKQGQFTEEVLDFAGMYVKQEYYKEGEKPKLSADVQIVINLKNRGLCFNSEKYEHSYPHCWRTDKPIIYYPMDSWFVQTTKYKKRMIELNKSINWKPSSTGEGRFGNWLENLVDWNLSRSRFWGIPIPIWRTEEGDFELCIGSIEELKNEIEKSISFGFMKKNPLKNFTVGDFTKENYLIFDLHKPYVDEIVLSSPDGRPLKRELDLIDVWFDSGAMPYAQLHYPFENKRLFESSFPADFIAEGVDQTRGWFFTLHAISTIISDSVAYKSVVSNGLVLDKNGSKMSKRLGNSVDPFHTIDNFGADATRWYMITNSQPWDNLRFDTNGVEEVKRKFFGTLHNVYSFFALYANIDGFENQTIADQSKEEIDRWIISELNTLVTKVEQHYELYEPTDAARLIQEFVVNKLSNWHVRLSRRRFWKGDYNEDKISAYQTLYECLKTISIIASPIAPFYMENLFQDLSPHNETRSKPSVHEARFPKAKTELIDLDLEKKMSLAQNITSLCLSLRKKEKIRVRQPLQKIIIPFSKKNSKKSIEGVESIIREEVNVKEVCFVDEDSGLLTKKIKPNFKVVGPKFGNRVRLITEKILSLSQDEIKQIEKEGRYVFDNITITASDVEISAADIPGYSVASNEMNTVALDITISETLKEEGLAREFVNRVQNIRKNMGLDVVDLINIEVLNNKKIEQAIKNNLTYICNETLAKNLVFVKKIGGSYEEVELVDSLFVSVEIKKA